MKKIYSAPRVMRVELENEGVICWSNGDGRPAELPAFHYEEWEEDGDN